MKAKTEKLKKAKPGGSPPMRVESPTWGQLQRMAEVVIHRLGGPKGAADGLSWESFYTLTLLAALNLDEEKSQAYIFGTRWLE